MFIDSHFHLPHEKYDKNPEEIISEALENDVSKLINIGTSIKENEKTLEISNEFKQVFSCVGIYPHDDYGTDTNSLYEKLKEQAQSSKKVVGIGECGVDVGAWENKRSLQEQIELFEMQCSLASELKLPLVIHNRNGNKEIIETLKKHKSKNLKGVSHCFVQDWEYAKSLLDLNFVISFTGIITYPSGKDILEIVKKVPEDKFLLETDSPYLAPQKHRGEINYPKYVKMVAEKVAQVKNLDLETVARLSYKNTCSLFNI